MQEEPAANIKVLLGEKNKVEEFRLQVYYYYSKQVFKFWVTRASAKRREKYTECCGRIAACIRIIIIIIILNITHWGYVDPLRMDVED